MCFSDSIVPNIAGFLTGGAVADVLFRFHSSQYRGVVVVVMKQSLQFPNNSAILDQKSFNTIILKFVKMAQVVDSMFFWPTVRFTISLI